MNNAAWYFIEQKLAVSRPRSYPLWLDIILTKACNLNCTFCISATVEGTRWLDFELYQRIARKLFPYARTLSLCSGGEPLLYPKIREVVGLAKSYRLNTGIVSNGMLLDDSICDWFTSDKTLDVYQLSFDGSTKATLEKIRRGARFETIFENVANLARYKHDRRVILPKVTLRYSVMKENIQELPAICSVARTMGADSVKVSFVNFTDNMNPEDSLYWDQDLCAKVFAETAARSKESGVAVHLPPLPRDDGHPRRCRDPWQFVQIDTDGSIRFCYRAWIQTVGNFDEGFDPIWRGEDYAKIRQTINTESPYFPYCRFCANRCGTNNEAAHNQKLHADAYTFVKNSTSLQPESVSFVGGDA